MKTDSENNTSEYKKVRIYKAASDSGLTSNISQEALNRAKLYVCGGENWSDRCARLRAAHGGSADKNIVVNAVIAKSNDDVRQEVFVMQMIHFYQSVFNTEGLPLFLKPYRILSTSKETGLIELLKDATSIDGLKKSDGYPGDLRSYFELVYGKPGGNGDFENAQRNFMQSLAGYGGCLVNREFGSLSFVTKKQRPNQQITNARNKPHTTNTHNRRRRLLHPWPQRQTQRQRYD